MYPVKSCAGTPLDHAYLGPRGILHDREFSVVDANHDLLTHRELPRLALIKPTYSNSVLTLTAPGMSRLSLEPTGDQRYPVSIWRDIVVAADQGEHVADWLSSYL